LSPNSSVAGSIPLTLLAVAVWAIPSSATIPSFVSRSSWVEIRTPEYTIVTDTAPGVRHDVARLLRRFSRMLLVENPGTRAHTAEPVCIYLFSGQEEMDHYRPATIESAGGCFIRTERGKYLITSARLFGLHELRATLHEYVHLYVHSNYEAMPEWVNEGLAEYYSTCQFTGDDAELGIPDGPPFARMAFSEPMSLDMLFAIRGTASAYREDNELRELFYAQSTTLVHLLQSSPERRAVFERFLADLRSGTRARFAFRASFPESTWARLTGELRPYARHILDAKTRRVRVPREDDDQAPATEVKLSRAEALTRLGELAANLSEQQLPVAAEHFQAALAIEDHASRAEACLGAVEDRMGHPVVAEQHYRRALSGTLTGAAVPVSAGQGTLERLRLATRGDASDDSLEKIARLAYGRFSLGYDFDPDDFGAVTGLASSAVALRLRPDTALVRRLAEMSMVTPGRPDVAQILTTLQGWSRQSVAARDGNVAIDVTLVVEADSLKALNELVHDGRNTEARALLVRMRDRTPAGGGRVMVEDMLARVDARERLDRAKDLADQRRFAEAEALVSPDLNWPDDGYRSEAARMLNYVRAGLAVEKANGLLRAGKPAEARAVLTATLDLEISDEMKTFIRDRIRKLDAAGAGK